MKTACSLILFLRLQRYSRLLNAALLATLLFLGAAGRAKAQYTFTLIADTTGPISDFSLSKPSLNSLGTVAFRAWLDNGSKGIFAGNGGVLKTIDVSALPFVGFGDPEINDAGTVAFQKSTGGSNNIEGVYIGNGGPLVPIAVPAAEFSNFGSKVSINSAGTVVFSASRNPPPGGFFTGNGGPPTRVLVGGISSINDAETIAYTQFNGSAIYTVSNGATTTIVNSSGSLNFFGSSPSLNNAGRVAFVAGIGGRDGGTYGIYSGNGGPLTTIADLSGPFNYFGDFYSNPPSINASGTVAFLAGLDAGGHGLFLGDGTGTSEVIHTGDAFFGSTVTGFAISPTSLNDNGQVAFAYGLANGTTGIAIATPVPEPSASLLLAGLPAIVGARRRGGRAAR